VSITSIAKGTLPRETLDKVESARSHNTDDSKTKHVSGSVELPRSCKPEASKTEFALGSVKLSRLHAPDVRKAEFAQGCKNNLKHQETQSLCLSVSQTVAK